MRRTIYVHTEISIEYWALGESSSRTFAVRLLVVQQIESVIETMKLYNQLAEREASRASVFGEPLELSLALDSAPVDCACLVDPLVVYSVEKL